MHLLRNSQLPTTYLQPAIYFFVCLTGNTMGSLHATCIMQGTYRAAMVYNSPNCTLKNQPTTPQHPFPSQLRCVHGACGACKRHSMVLYVPF